MAKQDTKQKIFDEAVNLLGEEGFAGLTLGTLAAKSGLSKSGLFAHFKSKADLESQVVEQVIQRGANSFIGKAMNHPKGLRRLKAFFEAWIGWTAKAGLKGGCPVASGFFELDDLPSDNSTRMKLQAMAREFHQLLEQLLSDAVETGELKTNIDKEQFIFEMYGIYLSHHVALRFHRSEQADKRALTAFKRLIEEYKKPK